MTVVDATGSQIGVTGHGNVISGNSDEGVSLAREETSEGPIPSSNTTIVGNIIGLDATGSAALGNGREGILGGSQGLTIGDTAPGGAQRDLGQRTERDVPAGDLEPDDREQLHRDGCDGDAASGQRERRHLAVGC